MNSNKQNIIFVISSSRTRKDSKASLMGRITYLKKRKQFTTGIFINPSFWNSKKQQAEPLEPDVNYINTQLSLIRQNLNQAFLFLQVKGTPFTVLDIYKKYKGEAPKDELGVIEVYKLHNARIKKLIGIEIKQVTYSKYLESGKHLQDFIKHKFKARDICFNMLKSNFLDDYEYFLKTEKKLQQSTLNKAIQRFRKVVKYAIAEDYLLKDPFILFRYKTVKKEVIFLSVDELQKLENHHFKITRMEKVKDLFIFCCYTGLAQSDGIRWQNDTWVETGATGTSIGTGSANTDAIISEQGPTETSYAAGLARAYTAGGYTDWFLPSKDELNQLYVNRAALQGFTQYYYWSSTEKPEYNGDLVWIQNINDGNQTSTVKYSTYYVRAVRAF